MAERVAIFIDSSNLSWCLQDRFDRFDIDYERLSVCLAEAVGPAAQLLCVYYYDAPLRQPTDPTRYAKQRRLLDSRGNDVFRTYLSFPRRRESRRFTAKVDSSLY